MRNASRIGLLILLGGSIAASIGFYVYTINTSQVEEDVGPIMFAEKYGTYWAKKCIEQYPEIQWLAHSKVLITQEGEASLDQPYSKQLFGERFIELDRTLMTLSCLKLILKGDYLEFTRVQPEHLKLSAESFRHLHLEGHKLVNSFYKGLSKIEIVGALETALVLGDIGKSEEARKKFHPYGARAPDHDDFHWEVMQILKEHPQLCPSFARLASPARQLLIEGANLAHYGHITHLEGGPEMFTNLKKSNTAYTSPVVLFFDLFVHKCNVAGALGHVNNQSSLVYTEWTYRAIQAMEEACFLLADPTKSEWDVYDYFLSKRAEWLGLDPSKKMDRVLSRVGAMLRLFTPEEGAILKDSIQRLDCDLIVSQFDFDREKKRCRTPTYVPAVLVNLSNNNELGASKEKRIREAIVLGLPFIAKVLEMHQRQLAQNKANPDIPLNFNLIASIAKRSPKRLLSEMHNVIIDQEGNVLLDN